MPWRSGWSVSCLSTNQIADEMRHHMTDIRGNLANRRISNAIKQVHICDQIDGLTKPGALLIRRALYYLGLQRAWQTTARLCMHARKGTC